MRNLVAALLWSLRWIGSAELQIVEMTRMNSFGDGLRFKRFRMHASGCAGSRVSDRWLATAIVRSSRDRQRRRTFHKGRRVRSVAWAWCRSSTRLARQGERLPWRSASAVTAHLRHRSWFMQPALLCCESKRDRIAMGAWLTTLEMRAPSASAVNAMANKLARIACRGSRNRDRITDLFRTHWQHKRSPHPVLPRGLQPDE